MSYVRKFGRPDLFITVTTNPNWEEITSNLDTGQRPHDRPELIVRVFRLKLQKMLQLNNKGCFGTLHAWLYNIELQKRGLPHAHMLLGLRLDSKVQPETIDDIVSAEIPNKDINPILYD